MGLARSGKGDAGIESNFTGGEEQPRATLDGHESSQAQLLGFSLAISFDQAVNRPTVANAHRYLRDPSIPVPGAVTSFKSIPIEIRIAIYELLLGEKKTTIVACRQHQRVRRTTPLDQEYGFLFVDKEIFAEAIATLYKRRTFHIGNGPYGSTSMPNMKGFREWIRQTKATYLSCITDLEIVFQLYDRLWECSLRTDDFCTAKMGKSYTHIYPSCTVLPNYIVENARNNSKDCHALIRAVCKYMTGLRSLRIRPNGSAHFKLPGYFFNELDLVGGGKGAAVDASPKSDNAQFIQVAVKATFAQMKDLLSVEVSLHPAPRVNEVMVEMSASLEGHLKVSISEDGVLITRDVQRFR